jgi:hypothetical protein
LGRKKLCGLTGYERHNASYQLSNSIEAPGSCDLIVWNLCAESEVAKSKQLNVRVILFVSLK